MTFRAKSKSARSFGDTMTLRTDYTNSTPLDDEHPDAHNDTNSAVNALDARIAALETAGTTIHNGAGPPPDTLGTDGDYYLDTTNGTLYGPATVTGTPTGPTLVWSDEFTGTSLDLSKWESAGTYFNYGDSGGGNKFSGVNLMSQIEVSGSRLKMHAIRENYPTDGRTPNPATWKTAAIQAKYNNGYRFKYGQRMEVSVNVPAISGIRPAIWISNRGGYPGYIADDADGEIDLFEQYFNAYDGGERNQYAAIWDYSPFKQNNDPEYGAGVASGPETYALEWDDTIRIYRGGILRAEFTTWASAHPRGGPPTFPRPFHDGAEYWVLITFQIGGRFSAHSYNGTDGSQYVQPVDPAYSAVTWEVDYIRVYDMDTGSGGSPTTSWPIALDGVPPGGTMVAAPSQSIEIADIGFDPTTINGNNGPRITFSQSGTITQVRYRREAASQATLTIAAWDDNTTNKIVEVTDTQTGATGEFTVTFPTPITVTAPASITFTVGGASNIPNFLGSPTVTNSTACTFHSWRARNFGLYPSTNSAEGCYVEPIFTPSATIGQTLKKTSDADYATGWT